MRRDLCDHHLEHVYTCNEAYIDVISLYVNLTGADECEALMECHMPLTLLNRKLQHAQHI